MHFLLIILTTALQPWRKTCLFCPIPPFWAAIHRTFVCLCAVWSIFGASQLDDLKNGLSLWALGSRGSGDESLCGRIQLCAEVQQRYFDEFLRGLVLEYNDCGWQRRDFDRNRYLDSLGRK